MKKLLAIIAICGFAIPAAAFAKGGFPEADAGSHDTTATNVQQTCPAGQAWKADAKKCVPVNAVNYNASKSNTGNTTAAPPPAPKNNPD